MSQIWITGRFYRMAAIGEAAHAAWALGGIFATRDAAVAACRCENDFIAPYELGRDYMESDEPIAGQVYPLNPRGQEPSMPCAIAGDGRIAPISPAMQEVLRSNSAALDETMRLGDLEALGDPEPSPNDGKAEVDLEIRLLPSAEKAGRNIVDGCRRRQLVVIDMAQFAAPTSMSYEVQPDGSDKLMRSSFVDSGGLCWKAEAFLYLIEPLPLIGDPKRYKIVEDTA